MSLKPIDKIFINPLTRVMSYLSRDGVRAIPRQQMVVKKVVSRDLYLPEDDVADVYLINTGNTNRGVYIANNFSGLVNGQVITFKKIDYGTGTVSLIGFSGDGLTSLLSAANESITVVFSDGAFYVLNRHNTRPFVYSFNSWNPSGTGATTTAPSSGAVSLSSMGISASLSSGTLTLTFPQIGIYKVCYQVSHTHAAAYTLAVFSNTFGGTATTYGSLFGFRAFGINADDSDCNAVLETVVEVGAANQTITWKPDYDSNGIASTSQHTARAFIIVTAL